MNAKQIHALTLRGIDVQGALRRCCGDEKLYEKCLRDFLSDTTLNELVTDINKQMWDDAFTAAHALKGLAGNMGFIPLMHYTGQLVISIRGGRTNEFKATLDEINSCYRDTIDAIHQFLLYQD